MFIVCPPEKQMNAKAMAVIDDTALMTDLKFPDDGAARPREGPNATVRLFFRAMLPSWSGRETVLLSHKEIAAQFNKENAGMYRPSCVASFMRPLISAGAVEAHNSQTLRIHVRRAAAILDP